MEQREQSFLTSSRKLASSREAQMPHARNDTSIFKPAERYSGRSGRRSWTAEKLPTLKTYMAFLISQCCIQPPRSAKSLQHVSQPLATPSPPSNSYGPCICRPYLRCKSCPFSLGTLVRRPHFSVHYDLDGSLVYTTKTLRRLPFGNVQPTGAPMASNPGPFPYTILNQLAGRSSGFRGRDWPDQEILDC
jgi:hypothetical protein